MAVTYFIQFQMKGYHTLAGGFRTEAGKRLGAEQSHEVGQYGLLQQAVNKQLQRRNKKKKRDRVADPISHCHSLDKLQQLNAQKNEEIKRHIYEKAQFQAHNEELKQLISNPTLREHKLHLRIAELQQQNRLLKQQLEQSQSVHRQTIQRLNTEHRTEIERLQQQSQRNYNQLIQNRPQSPRIDTHSHSQINKVETSHNRTNNDTRNYQQVHYTTQPTKPIPFYTTSRQETNKVQSVIHSSNYGSPVYISASSREEAKTSLPRALSPDTSKSTTNQTRIYRAESPQNTNSYISEPPRVIQANSSTIEHPKTIRTAIDPIRKAEAISSPRQPTIIRVSPPNQSQAFELSGRSLERRFDEGDLQQIYRKYCIND